MLCTDRTGFTDAVVERREREREREKERRERDVKNSVRKKKINWERTKYKFRKK